MVIRTARLVSCFDPVYHHHAHNKRRMRMRMRMMMRRRMMRRMMMAMMAMMRMVGTKSMRWMVLGDLPRLPINHSTIIYDTNQPYIYTHS